MQHDLQASNDLPVGDAAPQQGNTIQCYCSKDGQLPNKQAQREFDTKDDLVAEGMAINLKGIGEGIKKNVEETATNAAKGVVIGTVEGVKESIKDALPFKKTKGGDSGPTTQKAGDGQTDQDTSDG